MSKFTKRDVVTPSNGEWTIEELEAGNTFGYQNFQRPESFYMWINQNDHVTTYYLHLLYTKEV